MFKGALGATATTALAWVFGEPLPSLWQATALLMVGATGYGLSLRFYLLAQRAFGAARTGSVFAFAPFVGAALAFVLGDRSGSAWMLTGTALMIAGILLHLAERHAHEHDHGALEHEHAHSHDDGHHTHAHGVMPLGLHSHLHRHVIEREPWRDLPTDLWRSIRRAARQAAAGRIACREHTTLRQWPRCATSSDQKRSTQWRMACGGDSATHAGAFGHAARVDDASPTSAQKKGRR
jgi:hypothetical protein